MRVPAYVARMVLAAAVGAIVLGGTRSLAALPDSFNGWQATSSKKFTAAQLAAVALQDEPVVREFGFVDAERRDYTKGASQLTATLWHMVDGTASFGLFDYNRPEGMRMVEGADRVAIAADSALLQRGPHLLVVKGARLTSDEIMSLAAAVPKTRGRESLLPSLPNYLPVRAMIAESQRFAIGPVAFSRAEAVVPASAVGFEKGAEAVSARYRLGGGEARLILVSYPTPQFAAKMLREFEQLPDIKGAPAGKAVVRRKGSLVAFVFGAPSIAAAEKLLDQVNYKTNVVWDEYVPSEKDNVGSFMLPIFALAGFVLLFAFVAGLAFGGIRILAKRYIPVPIFDRPSQVEIIQLHLER